MGKSIKVSGWNRVFGSEKQCSVCKKVFSPRKDSLGKYCSVKCGAQGIKINLSGDKSPNWKNGKISYFGIHTWMKRVYGQPKECENCKTTSAKKFEWANISNKYKRDRADWRRLCTKCHHEFDKNKSPWLACNRNSIL